MDTRGSFRLSSSTISSSPWFLHFYTPWELRAWPSTARWTVRRREMEIFEGRKLHTRHCTAMHYLSDIRPELSKGLMSFWNQTSEGPASNLYEQYMYYTTWNNAVYSLKWRLTDRYLRWGTLAGPRPGRADANRCKSSDFLQELRISGFPRFWVSPTCFRAK